MTDSREGQKPKFRAILIGGPCDGETYGIYKEESTIFALDRTKTIPFREMEHPLDFGPRPAICIYILKMIAEEVMFQSKVRTYFYDKTLQDPHD